MRQGRPNRNQNNDQRGGNNNRNQQNRGGGNRGNQGGGNRGGGRHPRNHRRDRDEEDHLDLDRPGRLSPYQKAIDHIQVPQKEKKPLRNYAVLFFDTLAAAKSALPEIEAKAKEVDQLNIVIRAEASMDDPDLTQSGKVFAGAAWALIHDRRVADGWYNQPQE